MTSRACALTPCLLLVIGISCALTAQPAPGDVVFGKLDTSGPGPGLFWVDDKGKVGTILLTGGGRYPNALSMFDDNQSFLVGMSGSPSRLLRVAVNGAITTLFGVLPDGSVNGLARDQDGTWLVSSSKVNALLRFDPVAKALTTVYSHGAETNGIVNSVAIDGGSQEYLVGVFGSTASSTTGRVIRVNRSGTGVTTLTTGSSWQEISSVGWDYDHRRITVTKFTKPEFVRIGAGGALSTLAGIDSANAQRLTGQASFWVAGNGLVRRIDSSTGATIKTLAMPGYLPTAVLGHGDRSLYTSGSAASGKTLTFHLNSARPGDAGKSYYLAFSQFSSPGIPLPDGRMIRLLLDKFVSANLAGVLAPFWNGGTNIGVLDAQGRATARLTIPAMIPSSSRFGFYALFVTVDPAAPWGIGTISNVVPFTTNL